MTELTEQRLSEIQTRSEKYLSGEWTTPTDARHCAEDIPDLLAERAALKAEIKRLREAQEWIPVDERLPEDTRFVDVATSTGSIFIGWYDKYLGWRWIWGTGFMDHITHWRYRTPPEATP